MECRVIIGGDFNIILDPNLDGSGGNPKLKDSWDKAENICCNLDLIDIWRIRNPGVKRFSLRQKISTIQRPLDFWLIPSRGGGGWQRGLEPSLHDRPSKEIWPSRTVY